MPQVIIDYHEYQNFLNFKKNSIEEAIKKLDETNFKDCCYFLAITRQMLNFIQKNATKFKRRG